MYLEEGRGGLAVSREDAAEWYRKAADGGHTDAQYSLATLLLRADGDGGEDDLSAADRDAALTLLSQAAAKGHALSRRRLAQLTGDEAMAESAVKDHTLVSHRTPRHAVPIGKRTGIRQRGTF